MPEMIFSSLYLATALVVVGLYVPMMFKGE